MQKNSKKSLEEANPILDYLQHSHKTCKGQRPVRAGGDGVPHCCHLYQLFSLFTVNEQIDVFAFMDNFRGQ